MAKKLSRIESEIQFLSDAIDLKTSKFVDAKGNFVSPQKLDDVISLLEKWDEADLHRQDILRSGKSA